MTQITYQGLEVAYDYQAEQLEVPVSFDNAGGEPGYPAELVITAVKVEDLAEWLEWSEGDPVPKDLLEWAREDYGAVEACWEYVTEDEEER